MAILSHNLLYTVSSSNTMQNLWYRNKHQDRSCIVVIKIAVALLSVRVNSMMVTTMVNLF